MRAVRSSTQSAPATGPHDGLGVPRLAAPQDTHPPMSDPVPFDDFDRRWALRTLSRAIGWKRLVSWDPATHTLRAIFEVRPEFCHTRGTVAQGGFVTAWLDAAMAQAMMRDTGFEFNIATLELKVSFLRSVPPGEVLAKAHILKRGRRVAFFEAQLFDTSETELFATATSTGLVVPFVIEEE